MTAVALFPTTKNEHGQDLQPRAYIPSIDGVRAIAILLVLLIHFQIVPKSTRLERWLFFFTNFGWTGVDLFFVLSGFLITGILLSTRQSSKYFLAFYARRVLRIFPAYYLLLIGLLATGVLRGGPHAGFPCNPIWYVLYCQNIAMVGAAPVGGAYMVTWSLAVEEQYYLLWPIIVRKVLPRYLGAVLGSMFVLAPLIRAFVCFKMRDPRAAYVLMPCRMDALAAGGIVALLSHTEPLEKWRRRGLVGLLMGVCGVLSLVCVQKNFAYLESGTLIYGFSSLALLYSSALLLIVSSSSNAPFARWLSARWLRLVGRYSYAMYLFHIPVKSVALFMVPRLANPRSVPYIWGTQWVLQILFYALAATITFLLAALSWYVLERRMLALKDRWQY